MRLKLRHTLWILAVLATLVSALTAAAVWRLSQGPVNLALLAPYVESALSRPEAGYSVEMDTVEAAWAGWNRMLRFVVSDAKLLDLEGRALVETQGLEFSLSAGEILGGRIVPRDIQLLGIGATLRRRSDGSVGLIAVAAKTGDELEEIDLGGLLGGSLAGGGIRFADLGVRGAALTVVDDIMGVEWSVPRLDLGIRDGTEGRVAEGVAFLHLGEEEIDIGFILSLSGEAGGPSLSVQLDGLRPRAVAEAHPVLAPLRHVTTPLSGSIAVHFGADYTVVSFESDLQGAGGAIIHPQHPERHVAVDGLAIRARAVDSLTRLEIEAVEVRALGRTARLSGGGAWQDGVLSAFTHLEDVTPALLAPLLAPHFTLVSVLDAPISGTAAWTLDPNFQPMVLDFGLTIGAGRLYAAGLDSEAAVLKGGSAIVQADLPAGQILVESLDLELGHGHIRASGSGKRRESGWQVHLKGEAAAIPVDDLQLLWPPDAGSPGAREWVLSNLSKGQLDEVRIVVDADMAAESGGELGLPVVDGSLSFSGVTARYWRPLPSFEDISGSATFDARSFKLSLSGGAYRDIAIAGATLDFLGLDRETPPPDLAADVKFQGTLGSILNVLDHEPLGYARYLQMDPAVVRGAATFRLRAGLPLLAALALDDVTLEAEGEVVDAHFPVAALKTGLARARIDINADKTHVAISGGGSLGGQPATFDIEQRFPEREPVETFYRLHTIFDKGTWARLGFDLAPYANGPVEVDIAASEYRDGTADYTLKAGLGGADIRLAPLGWTKPVGEPAWLEAKLRIGADRLLQASPVTAAGPGLELAGEGRFDLAESRLLEASLSRLRIGDRTDIAVQVEPLPDGVVSIQASGPSVDLSAYLEDKDDGDNSDHGNNEDNVLSEQEGLDRLAVRFDVDRAWLGGAEPLHGLAARIHLDGERISEAEMDARTANGRTVSASFLPNGNKTVLTVGAEDTGALLAALGWYRNMRGGHLRLSAERPVAVPDEYRGSLIIKDFRRRDAPVLTRLLAAASLAGLGDALSGDAGLQFKRLETPLHMKGRNIGIGPGRAFGNSIGVTFRGEFDRDQETVAISGVLVPVYFLSRALSKIPLIGDLLTGGGEGLFAANYELLGPLTDPKTTVNPLSVLAPGFLRGLFGPLLGAEGQDWNPDADPTGASER